MTNTPLWKIFVACTDADEQAHLAIECGGAGVEILSETLFALYFQGDEAACQDLIQRLPEFGLSSTGSELVADHNWVQECEEVWKPLQLGALVIQPVMDDSNPPQKKSAGELQIVPGLGFGTGHHATTAMIIERLQALERPQGSFQRIADVGTGSGILALAAAHLLGTPVVACDTDAAALDNARTNLSLNNPAYEIELRHGSVDQLDGTFDLIIANIYAEVLIELEPQFCASLSTGGTLILSGIMARLRDQVVNHFCGGAGASTPWTLAGESARDGWVALELRR